VDLDAAPTHPPAANVRAQAFTLWLRASDFRPHAVRAAELVRELLSANPFTTLQVVLEPTGSLVSSSLENRLPTAWLGGLLSACLESPTYLDKFYALQPGRPNGAKRLVVLLPRALRSTCDPDWLAGAGESASLVWSGAPDRAAESALEPHEYERV
jgi:hypothetical protein